ncbi:MAG: ABC transporter permease [Proteobacteria bacterium]|nr:MAG: ABC transporter permease [Pseudomonadota bacterium]
MNSVFDFALLSINRFGWKNLSIAFIFALLVWLLSSVIFITNSLKYTLQSVAEQTSQILINKQIGGKSYPIDKQDIEPLWDMAGVSYVKGRVWGQHYLEFKKTYISLMGVSSFEEHYNDKITKIAEILPQMDDISYMYISKNMKDLLKIYTSSENIVSFEKLGGGHERVKIAGIFKDGSELFSNDVVLMNEESVRKILGVDENKFTDIIIKVENPNEVDFIAAKLTYKYPHFKLTTKSEILKDYELLFQYKSGWFLLIFIISFITFAIILYDKSSGLRSEEKKEIGILKALGWEINHIIYYKMLESLILCMGAFLLGLSLAIFFVYFLQAPALKYVFTGYSELKQDFDLPFVFNLKEFFLLFFSTVPLYMAVCIIPSWKTATRDVGDIIR